MIDAKIKIDASSAQRALAALTDRDLRSDVAQLVANEVVRPALAKYPPPSGKKQPFKTDKSRRFFFAALEDGKIKVPYPRSGNLGGDWVGAPFGDGWVLTSGREYSEMVLGPNQAAYFKGTWPTTEMVAKACEQPAAEMATVLILKRVADA